MKKLLSILQVGGLLTLVTQVVYAIDPIEIKPPANIPEGLNFGDIITAVIGILIIFAAILAFLYLILGGIQWITSGGDKAGMESARNKITAAIVGLIIVAAAWAIMVLLGQFIGFDIKKLNIPSFENPQG